MNSHYPVFLDLRGRRCLVVGDTELAAGKARDLEESGAVVMRSREFDPADSAGFFLIVADVQAGPAEQIRAFGNRERIFVNIVDKPEYCSFILPAILRQGELTVAVSTGGASPSLAGWIRRRLERLFGEEYGHLVAELRQTRELVKERIPGYGARKEFYYSLFESGILEAARRSGRAGVRTELDRRLEEFAA